MKHIRTIIWAASLLLAGSLASCRKEAPALQNPNETRCSTWLEVFDYYWDGMNCSYAFWDIDPTDWDEVYTTYRPRFEALGDWEAETLDEAEQLFTELTANLIDHHYGLQLYHPETGEVAATIVPSEREIRQRDYYHERMSSEQLYNIVAAYRDSGRITELVGGSTQADIDSPITVYSFLIDNVAYLYLDTFALSELLPAAADDDPALCGWRNFWSLIENTVSLRGVIIDVRNNGGGYLHDMQELVGRLTAETHLFGYSRTKIGLGRLDYTPWTAWEIYPTDPDQKTAVSQPIVLLTDLYSMSMSEMTAMAIRSLPNGHLVGERTYGGQGIIFENYQQSYAGEFKNNALRSYMTSTMSKDAEGNILEGIGITPDREALFDAEQFAAGTDTQLEAALDYIRSLE